MFRRGAGHGTCASAPSLLHARPAPHDKGAQTHRACPAPATRGAASAHAALAASNAQLVPLLRLKELLVLLRLPQHLGAQLDEALERGGGRLDVRAIGHRLLLRFELLPQRLVAFVACAPQSQ